jgi:hypothetical protein
MSGIAPVSRSAKDRSPPEPREKPKREDGERPGQHRVPKPLMDEAAVPAAGSHTLNVSA